MSIMTSTEKKVSLGLITLTILLVIFKLTNVIDWSWLAVTSPLWAPALVIIIVFNLAMVVLILSDKK